MNAGRSAVFRHLCRSAGCSVFVRGEKRSTGQSTGIKADVVGCSMLTRNGDTFLGLDDRIRRDTLSTLTSSLFIQ